MAWVDFKQISASVPFKSLLDSFGIPYAETEKEIRTERIIVNKEKNLYFLKGTKDGGNVINFTAKWHNTDLREAALWLQKTFLTIPPEPKRALPELELKYHQFLSDNGIEASMAEEYEVGYANKGIMSGKIAFKVMQNGEHMGYVGKELKKEGYFFPKGFKAGELVYNLDRVTEPSVFLCSDPLDCLILITRGFPNSIALFTKSATDQQLEKLKRYNPVIIFHPAGENIATRLSQQCYVRLIKKDLAEMTHDEIRTLT